LYRRLGEPQGRSGQARKISPPMGFDPRTVQPLASRYIDYATRPTVMRETSKIITSPEFKINLGIEIFKLKKVRTLFLEKSYT
jgi:hypothetical protein